MKASPIKSLVAVAIASAAAVMQTPAQAQQVETEKHLVVTATEALQAATRSHWWAHAKPRRPIASGEGSLSPKALTFGAQAAPVVGGNAPNLPAAPSPVFYPGDVTYGGGPTVPYANEQNIFVNSTCSPAGHCWGLPRPFENDLQISNIITIVDQYVGQTGSDRYATLPNQAVSIGLNHVALDTDLHPIILASVNAAGGSSAGGYTNIYHVFLPQGQDICMDNTLSNCYAPDGAGVFTFCGYHSSFDVVINGALTHILYTVEPYANVDGCALSTPNGFPQELESQDSILLHETVETITDPDGNAWIVAEGSLQGSEIADVCEFAPFVQTIGTTNYYTQLVYSNLSHACQSSP